MMRRMIYINNTPEASKETEPQPLPLLPLYPNWRDLN
jgi:hypothetical protein